MKGVGSASTTQRGRTARTAAAMLGMSVTSFETYVQPDLRLIRRGKLRLVPVAELDRWCEANAESVLDRSR